MAVIHGTMQYPGDPPQRVVWTTVAAWLAAQRDPRVITLYTAGEPTVVIPIGDDVLCDVCGAAVTGETMIAVVEGQRVYCPTCTEEWVTPWVRRGSG